MSSSMAKPTGPLRATPITNSTNLPEQTGKKVYFNKINLVTTPDHFWPLECLRKRLHKINCTVAMSKLLQCLLYYMLYRKRYNIICIEGSRSVSGHRARLQEDVASYTCTCMLLTADSKLGNQKHVQHACRKELRGQRQL